MASEQAIAQGVQMCPFLRNISEPTSFKFMDFGVDSRVAKQAVRKGPIFEDGLNFDVAFKLFHGSDGVVPLARPTEQKPSCPYSAFLSTARSSAVAADSAEASPLGSAVADSLHFQNALAASTATISLSAFGPAGPFSFRSFKDAQAKKEKEAEEARKRKEQQERDAKAAEVHESEASEWLATGKCPIAKTYRAFNGVIPLVAKLLTPPPGMKYQCPPAIVAARAALARTPAVKALRPQALPVKVLAVGALGMGLNVPLGVWREHCEKFSPQWILAVHAAVPLVAMLRKAVLMPKYAMAFTIASCVIGQTMGAKFEKRRLAGLKQGDVGTTPVLGLPSLESPKKARRRKGQALGSDDAGRASASSLVCAVNDEVGRGTESVDVNSLQRCSGAERSSHQLALTQGSGPVEVC